ncbi:calcium-activated chloride channel-domain-containing protein, partial [Gorgonomyces haynaldii]
AMQSYGRQEGSYHLAQMLFTRDPAPDFVLKYDAHEHFDQGQGVLRKLYIQALLDAGVILQFEMYQPCDPVRFLQGFIPFETLCREAEATNQTMRLSIGTLGKILPAYAPFEGQLSRRQISWESPWNSFAELQFDPMAKRSVPFEAQKLKDYEGGDFEKYGYLHVKKNFFDNADRANLTFSIISYLKVSEDEKSKPWDLTRMLYRKVFTECYAVHDGKARIDDSSESYRTRLYNVWSQSFSFRQYYPIEDVRSYFGERTAFYIAWLSYFTMWLQGAAILGFLVLLYGVVASIRRSDLETEDRIFLLFDNEATLVYAFLMNIWALAFVHYWKRQSASLAFVWDAENTKHAPKIRPQWRPTHSRISPTTGEQQNYVPDTRRFLIQCFNSFLILILLGFLLACIVGLITFNAWVKSNNVFFLYSTMASTLFSVFQILLFRPFIANVATFLNNLENYKFKVGYEQNLVLKRFMFDFVNNFAYIFHFALFKPIRSNLGSHLEFDFGFKDSCQSGDAYMNKCTKDTIVSIAVTMIGLKMVSQLFEAGIPYLYSFFKKSGVSKEAKKLQDVPQFLADLTLIPFTMDDQASDYGTKIVELGYVVMLSAIFPLAPVLAYFSSLSEMRLDMWKRLCVYQKPLDVEANSIGIWQGIAEGICRLGSITSAILVAFNSATFEAIVVKPLATEEFPALAIKITFVLFYEHLVLLLSLGLTLLVPQVPKRTETGIKAEEFIQNLR